VRLDFTWDKALAAVLAFADAPHHAADYVPGRDGMGIASGRTRRTSGVGHTIRMTWHHLRASGVRDVAGRISRRLRGPGS
jgi:hypothetical protein